MKLNTSLSNRNLLSLEKLPKKTKMHSNIELPHVNNFFFSQPFKTNHRSKTHRYYSSSHNKNKLIKSFMSTESSTIRGIHKIRKDVYGNTIEKGGNQRISFRDNVDGKPLVETTLIDLKKIIKKKKITKDIKKDIIKEEKNDKTTIICSSVCNIF
jgi:hypothetical protein